MSLPASLTSPRPTVLNRTGSMDALWQDLETMARDAAEFSAKSDSELSSLVDERNHHALPLVANRRFTFLMAQALVGLRRNDASAAGKMREACASQYWAVLAQRAVANAEGWGDDDHDPLLEDTLWLHGIAAGCGAPEIADQLAPGLHRRFREGGAMETPSIESDTGFRLFHQYLAAAQVERRWPSRIDHDRMLDYGRLLETAGDHEAFATALIDFCDFRIARCLGFDSMQTARRRRYEEGPITVFEGGGWPTLWPVELYSLRHAYRRATGKDLSLEADHPLLRSPVASPPTMVPLYEEGFVRHFKSAVDQFLGPGWQKALERGR